MPQLPDWMTPVDEDRSAKEEAADVKLMKNAPAVKEPSTAPAFPDWMKPVTPTAPVAEPTKTREQAKQQAIDLGAPPEKAEAMAETVTDDLLSIKRLEALSQKKPDPMAHQVKPPEMSAWDKAKTVGKAAAGALPGVAAVENTYNTFFTDEGEKFRAERQARREKGEYPEFSARDPITAIQSVTEKAQQYVGAPLIESQVMSARPLMNAVLPEYAPLAEMMYRNYGALFGGTQVAENMPKPLKLEAVKELDQAFRADPRVKAVAGAMGYGHVVEVLEKYGPAYTLALAQVAGEAPLLMTGAGVTGAAEQAAAKGLARVGVTGTVAKVLAQAAGVSAEGAVSAGVEGVVRPGQDPFTNAAFGATLGPTLMAGGALVKGAQAGVQAIAARVPRRAKPVMLEPEVATSFFDELSELGRKMEPELVGASPSQSASSMLDDLFSSTPKDPSSFKPTMYSVDVRADGTPVVRFTELRAGDAAPRQVDVPVTSPEGAKAAFALVRVHKLRGKTGDFALSPEAITKWDEAAGHEAMQWFITGKRGKVSEPLSPKYFDENGELKPGFELRVTKQTAKGKESARGKVHFQIYDENGKGHAVFTVDAVRPVTADVIPSNMRNPEPVKSETSELVTNAQRPQKGRDAEGTQPLTPKQESPVLLISDDAGRLTPVKVEEPAPAMKSLPEVGDRVRVGESNGEVVGFTKGGRVRVKFREFNEVSGQVDTVIHNVPAHGVRLDDAPHIDATQAQRALPAGDGGGAPPASGGGGGRKLPPDPPIAEGPVIPPRPERPENFSEAQIPEASMAAVKESVAIMDAMRQGRGNMSEAMWKKIVEGVVPVHQRGGLLEPFNATGRKAAAAEDRIRSRGLAAKNLAAPDETLKALQKTYGVKEWSDFDKALSDFGDGKIDVTALETKHPQQWAKAKEYAEPLFREMETNSSILEELTGQTFRFNKGDGQKYMARIYRAHYLPKGKWVEIMPTQLLDDAAQFFAKEAAKEGRTVNTDEIVGFLQDTLKLEDGTAIRAALAAHPNAKPFKHLLSRDETLPEPIRKLLGEENSGIIRMAHTVATQRSLIANLQLWREVSHSEELSSAVKTDYFRYKVPDNRRMYGDASGKYISENVAPLLELPKAIDDAWGMLRSITGTLKLNQIGLGGARPWTTAVMSNIWHSRLTGGLDLLRPVESGQSFAMAFKALLAFDRAPTGRMVGKAKGGVGKEFAETMADQKALADIVLEARRFNVDMPGQGATEIGGPKGSRLVRALEAEMQKLPADASIHRRLAHMGGVMTRTYSGAAEHAGHAYDLIDRTFKLANYISLRQKLLRQFDGDIEKAATEAARRINLYFPNAQAVGKVPAAMRKVPLVFNRYVTFASENIRIHATVPAQLGGDFARAMGAFKRTGSMVEGYRAMRDPGLSMRIGSSVILAGLASQTLRAARLLNGISDEETKAAILDQSERTKAFRPFLIALPIRRSENGPPIVIDLSPWWGPSSLLSGHPDDAMWQRITANVIKTPVSGEALERPLDGLLSDAGLTTKFRDYELRQDQQGASALVKQLIREGTVPGVVNRAMDSARQTDALPAPLRALYGSRGKTEEKLTPLEAVLDQGVAVVPYTPPGTPSKGDRRAAASAHVAAAKETMSAFRDFESTVKAIATDPSLTPEEKRERIREVKEPLMKQIGRQREKNQAVRDARNKQR